VLTHTRGRKKGGRKGCASLNLKKPSTSIASSSLHTAVCPHVCVCVYVGGCAVLVCVLDMCVCEWTLACGWAGQNAKMPKCEYCERGSQSERTSSPPSWPLLIIVHLAVTEKGREFRNSESERERAKESPREGARESDSRTRERNKNDNYKTTNTKADQLTSTQPPLQDAYICECACVCEWERNAAFRGRATLNFPWRRRRRRRAEIRRAKIKIHSSPPR